ncbi:class I SAM-dependent methyltransferase [Aminithiophilus ramosus]|uniref:class I SAM-dependent methyltransferase n=1 Tax=Aminithiophilus ramosus TaxID=3029084 RepID=UPI002367A822|nr:class I SAM-dependent methyltransferase [Aminithiophilus ramosus]
MSGKGRAFTGFFGGARYDRFAALFGMKAPFYRKALGPLALGAGERALDLGCGPGPMTVLLASRAHGEARIWGIDLSEEQLAHGRTKVDPSTCPVTFLQGSMDELPFPDGHFDLVMTSMALHETPPPVRRGTVAEVARVLKEGGSSFSSTGAGPAWGSGASSGFPSAAGVRGTKTTGTTSTPDSVANRDFFPRRTATSIP